MRGVNGVPLVRRGGKIKYILIAYFLGNIYAKNCRNRTVYVKIIASCKGGVFFETQCRLGLTHLTHFADYISTLFAGFVTTGGFTQFINFHTRGNNLLDFVLSNNSEMVCSISPRLLWDTVTTV